jgi:deoxyribonuclease V
VDIKELHPWNVSPKEAVEIQKRLQSKVSLRNRLKSIRYLAGADVSCSLVDDTCWAGLVLVRYPALEPVEERWAQDKISFQFKANP